MIFNSDSESKAKSRFSYLNSLNSFFKLEIQIKLSIHFESKRSSKQLQLTPTATLMLETINVEMLVTDFYIEKGCQYYYFTKKLFKLKPGLRRTTSFLVVPLVVPLRRTGKWKHPATGSFCGTLAIGGIT